MMGRKTAGCIVALALSLNALLPLSAAAAMMDKSWNIDVGLEVESFAYEEFVNGKTFMKEDGPQYGIYGAGTVYLMESFMVHTFMSYVGADLDYTGGLQGTDPSTGRPFVIPGTGTSPNSIFNFRLLGGYRLPLAAVDVTPFAGMGYRFLKNTIPHRLDLEGYGVQSNPCWGYKRDQSYTYIPIGLQVGGTVAGAWRVEGKAEYDLFLNGENRSYNLDCDDDTTFEQDSGSGYRASVQVVSPPVYGGFSVTIEPFYEHWKVDDSTIVDGAREPENESDTYGVRFGARF